MSADPKPLYQEVILDHNKKPRNYGTLEHASHQAEGLNPLCGDHIYVALNVEGDAVHSIAFHGESCAICKASASMMTMAVKGKTPAEAEQLVHAFVDMATGRDQTPGAPAAPALPGMARLSVFSGIRDLPMRVKCAILPWHTLQAALNSQTSVTTEAQADPMQAPMGDA
ncbi:Fe-S cluster assembly sulfur transfer protein SufU [Candidatus Aalborgicola defluviihabitans]|jgi:nitrogen fixation NifU-like protein|uniref:Fe-S cluster assembly sulfur transfer protein SufU n=1 Tax=Candidatus Aalborgicola defluviihabitans TaxID=3386187 RepID=UPI001DEC1D15|nr:SUF system NifU family Fe-S cluster assembly protein [Burkholderiales bacterium]MBK7282042.1 SUF system NifU family Fe-S cluster assembly protein [Burkholderiales bacterium]MBK7315058.1 SUF system NifU family Fe-S cluster assembly protein [Burkholderiales bacterium]MBL0242500.1 SUF system NifU family Fe-S cluster assembly protein [Rhodoferax sp.]